MNQMVEQVLLLCPGCDREEVENDLNLTGDLERTINHALDGLLSPCKPDKTGETTKGAIDDILSPTTTKYTSIKEKSSDTISTSNQHSGNFEQNIINSINIRSSLKFVDIDDLEMDDNLGMSGPNDKKSTTASENVACVFREMSPDSDESLPAAFDDHEPSNLLSRLTARNTFDYIEEDVLEQSGNLGSFELEYGNDDDVLRSISSANDVYKDCQTKEHAGGPGDCSSDKVPEIAKKRKKRSKDEIEEQKLAALLKKQAKEKERQEKLEEKKRQKEAKALEREQKKKEAEKEKLQKKAEKLTQSTLTIGACVKLVTVCLDPSIVTEGNTDPSQNFIIHKLSSMEANYKIQAQPFPSSVTWLRASVEHSVERDEMTITASNTYSEECEVLVVLQADQFAEMVYAFKQGNEVRDVGQPETLVEFTNNVKSLYQGKKITYLLTGLEKYMRNVKTKQQRAFRDAATASSSEDSDVAGRKKRKRKLGATVNVTRTDIEEALVDLQFKTNVCVYPCEDQEDVAMKVGLFTKAIAERPYKKSLADGFGFCLDKLDKTTLKVSKDGQGLVRVWQQQIEQFRNVSKDMAAAIVANYPSPQLLLTAYNHCGSKQEAELLLQDILVRRGGGSLATSRRIGPELSKRIYLLFHSKDNTQLMKH